MLQIDQEYVKFNRMELWLSFRYRICVEYPILIPFIYYKLSEMKIYKKQNLETILIYCQYFLIELKNIEHKKYYYVNV